MNIHEYQAKELLKKFDIPVPAGEVAFTSEEACSYAKNLEKKGVSLYVVKAQIHAGGRGKGKTRSSGVKGVTLVRSPEEVKKAADALLGDTLVTVQTGSAGKKIERIYITEGVDIRKEYYVSVTLDRARNQNVIIASEEGGVEIEKIAKTSPEKIIKEWVEPGFTLQNHQARRLAYALGFSGDLHKKMTRFFIRLYDAYEVHDASIVEVNPLVLTKDNEILALDAKITFDDHALYRQSEISGLRDETEEDPLEREASAFGLNYIRLDGNVGCMVNGAGLAMATMDLIKISGGEPANFLDVGGHADVNAVRNGFRIILKDPNVKAILINIFGGIVRCDRVANGIIEAAHDPETIEKLKNIPTIVRLEGTNAEEAKILIDESGLNVVSAPLFQQAADEVARAIGKL